MKPSRNKIKSSDLIELYDKYHTTTLEEFRSYCRNLIVNSRMPNKDLIEKIDTMSKDDLLKATNNFAMKGHGYGVI